MTGIVQSPEELQEHLHEQIAFLKASAKAFDEGFEGEAKRLAVTIRVLVHDTRNSTSLLSQLNLKTQLFHDTTLPDNPRSLTSYFGLIGFFIGNKGPNPKYIPLFDSNDSVLIPFDSWWQGVVFRDNQRNTLTRRDLILSLANQDGGAHIDPALNESYAKLSRHNSLGWTVGDRTGSRPMNYAERPAARQIAHEVLKTLEPTYTYIPPEDDDGYYMEFSVKPSKPEPVVETIFPKVGRNESCPCGSERKYKKCHGK